MTYNKPQIMIVAQAIATVQGSMTKGWPFLLDADNVNFNAVATAYEADE
jgi:hypothetical protein